MSDEDDEETYMEGGLELERENSQLTLIGYDGCFALPKEVIDACRYLGLKIDKEVE